MLNLLRRSRTRLAPLVALGAAVGLSACSRGDDSKELLKALENAGVKQAQAAESPQQNAVNPRLLRRFAPLRPRVDIDVDKALPARIDLGRMLYFDERLSKNHDLSCNSCHGLERYGVDNEVTSPGHRGVRGARNSPTVYNAAGLFTQFWDGRATTVEEQAAGPLLNPVEMAMPDGAHVVRVLKSMPGYVEAFEKAFPEVPAPVTFENVGRAIGAFERGLTTPSRWDEYLQGNSRALSEAEVEGLKAFTNLGCMVCHTGEFVGGSMYQKVGAVTPWPNQADPGRFAMTKNEADRMVFRVPTLRNVARTAPYFHDGSAKTLPEAVRLMGKHQLGIELGDAETASIVAWLDSMTGALPTAYIKEPTLPASTPATPKPDPR
ncbi:MAG TPA: cytochrome c peroxidase [Polyangiaceae bacterium]